MCIFQTVADELLSFVGFFTDFNKSFVQMYISKKHFIFDQFQI